MQTSGTSIDGAPRSAWTSCDEGSINVQLFLGYEALIPRVMHELVEEPQLFTIYFNDLHERFKLGGSLDHRVFGG